MLLINQFLWFPFSFYVSEDSYQARDEMILRKYGIFYTGFADMP